MARVFIALILLLVALSAVPLLAGNTGYVLISFGDWAVDGTAVAFISWALITLLVIWMILYLAIRGRRLSRAIGRFFSLRSDRKITLDVEQGLVAFAEQDWATAEQRLSRVASYTDYSDGYLLLAAYAAANQGDGKQAFELVHKIESASLQLKARGLAIKLDDGELLAQMLAKGDDASLPVTVALEKENWADAAEALKSLKTSRKVSKDLVDGLYLQVLQGWLPWLLKVENVDSVWHGFVELPKNQKQRWENIRLVLPLLVENGKQDEAMKLIKPWIKRQPEDEILLDIAKQKWSDTQPLSVKVQSWLKKDPNAIPLLTALGHLAYRAGDADLAKKALARVVRSTNQSEDWLAYAEVCEKVGDKQTAIEAFKKAAEAH